MQGAGIYCGGPLYQDSGAIEDLKNSGFTTVVAWSVHVEQNGDLAMNNDPLVTGGSFAGPAQLLDLNGIKDGGSVTRLVFSVGAGGTSDFTNIANLIEHSGTGPGSPLRTSFAALQKAIPTIDAIDFDDEDNLNADTIVAFGQMLVDMDWQVTFCPYCAPEVWMPALSRLWAYKPGSVAGMNLQCYSGGAGNDPGYWIGQVQSTMGQGFDAESFVSPGLWCKHTDPGGPSCQDGLCPDQFTSQLSQWRSASGITSGWLWLYDDVLACAGSQSCGGGSMDTAAYAQAILSAFE